MERTTWRTGAGLLLALAGAAVLAWSLGRPPAAPPEAPPGEAYRLRLSLLGRPLAALPLSPQAVAAALWIEWLALPLLPLLLGLFFIFLDTPRGARLEARLLERVRKRDGAP